jgi:hypothetical protein
MRYSLLLSCLLIGSGACARVLTTPVPAPSPGDRIRYAGRADSTRLVPAHFVSLDPDSLVFERFVSGDPAGHRVTAALATDAVARLQVRVGRRGNAGIGALVGGAVGLGLGIACATEESGFVTPEACLAGYTVLGAGTGLVIGLLVRTDVWAPVALPRRAPEAPMPPGTISRTGIGLRIPY